MQLPIVTQSAKSDASLLNCLWFAIKRLRLARASCSLRITSGLAGSAVAPRERRFSGSGSKAFAGTGAMMGTSVSSVLLKDTERRMAIRLGREGGEGGSCGGEQRSC
mmetsp:Transcript_104631/g.234934  ORF Transcript_104631/g.234934 Transcript_104631/m.234934 type:complete len:107 (-) Transcript_104631:456-776(-)